MQPMLNMKRRKKLRTKNLKRKLVCWHILVGVLPRVKVF